MSIFAVIDTTLSMSVIKTQLIGSQYLRFLTYGLAMTGKEQYNVTYIKKMYKWFGGFVTLKDILYL